MRVMNRPTGANAAVRAAVTPKPLDQALLKRWVAKAFLRRDDDGNRVLRFSKGKLVATEDESKLPSNLRALRKGGAAVYKLDAYGNTVYASVPKIALFSTADFWDRSGKKLNSASVDEMSGRLFWLR